MLVNPLQDSVVDTVLLLVLCCREGHALLLLCTILVGEDNHQVLTGEMLHQFVGQPVERILIRNGTFTGCDYHKHVVLADIFCQSG